MAKTKQKKVAVGATKKVANKKTKKVALPNGNEDAEMEDAAPKDAGNQQVEGDKRENGPSTEQMDASESKELEDNTSERVNDNAEALSENGSDKQPKEIVPPKARGRKRKVVEKPVSTNTKRSRVSFGPDTLREARRHVRGPGTLLTLGQGDVGQLGLGADIMERKKPTPVVMDKQLLDVCSGGMHTVCLTEEGEVYTFGCNDNGALGRDTSEDESETSPGKVDLPDLIVQISAGDSHTAALSDSGDVYIWGNFRDLCGYMGLVEPEVEVTRPLRILRGVKVTKISSGNDHLVMLSSDGHLYTCGCAQQGQLGRVAEQFTDRGGRKGLALLLTPTQVYPKNRALFDDIWAGGFATFARARKTGRIYACGLNNYYQLGFKDNISHFTFQPVPSFHNKMWSQIAPDMHHTLALDQTGKVYSLGRKEYGRLGLGPDADDSDHPTPIPALEDIKCIEVSCGGCASFAVSSDGAIYSWGMASAGHLGTGDDDEDLWEPRPVTGKHLEGKKVLVASSGGQHLCLIVNAT